MNQCMDKNPTMSVWLLSKFKDIVVVWLLCKCTAAGFGVMQWFPSTWLLSSSDSLRAGTEIDLIYLLMKLDSQHFGK